MSDSDQRRTGAGQGRKLKLKVGISSGLAYIGDGANECAVWSTGLHLDAKKPIPCRLKWRVVDVAEEIGQALVQR